MKPPAIEKVKGLELRSPDSRRFNASEADFPAICSYIEETCARMRSDERQRVLLLIEELFANSITHGYGGDSDQPVWLTLIITDDACVIDYEDCAPPHNPFEAPDLNLDETKLEDRRIGGLGIMLLSEFSSNRGYERRNGRNCIRLQVRRAPTQAGERRQQA